MMMLKKICIFLACITVLFPSGISVAGARDYFLISEGSSNPEARVIWEYRETPDFFSLWGGDADRLPNGNTLITDSANGRIIEVTMDGEKVWEVIFDNVPYHFPPDYALYRAERTSEVNLTETSLYNASGWPTPYNITVTVWDQEKTFNGITFTESWGTVWAINMTGHAVWKYDGYWIEQKLLPNGHLLLLRGVPRPGKHVIREIDLNGNVIYGIKVKAHHDVLRLSKKHLLYLTKTARMHPNGAWKGDEIHILNLPKRQVVWKWNTFDYLSTDHYCPMCIKKVPVLHLDWTHSNSLSFQIEGDRKVLFLSVRNLNQIIKIDAQTKEIIWTLGEKGDFQMFEMNGTEVTKLFSHQHDPEILPNGNILLFDNGHHRGGGKNYTRVIEIKLV